MAEITTTARPFDDDLEDFEVRIRINEERNPQLKAPEDKRPLDDRFEVRLSGSIQFSNESDTRRDIVIPFEALTEENFPSSGFTAGDLVKLRQLMAKFHASWKSRAV